MELQTRAGSPHYISPEMIEAYQKNDEEFGDNKTGTYGADKVDLWMIGVLTFKLLTGKYPFEAGNLLALTTKILRGEIEWPEQVMMSFQMKKMVMSLLERDVKNEDGLA
eukprot:TRINITY_DN17225_c0_g1_i1.p1 TRINITY_DN17225_c0_g1~~TRINITY_DN17225_c0_g1_i1.p1  ORF type:complete len:109 (+),score=19.28 TRINITY_DN17225_c0_g1_i1:59-385(+)